MNELLIASVYKREPLWNPSNELHKNAVVLKKLWEEVAFEIEKDVKTVKAKWKNLRAYFFKECRKYDNPKSEDSADEIYKGTWQHYDQLIFLKSKTNQCEITVTNLNLKREHDDNYSLASDITLEELQNPGSVQSNSTSETALESQKYSPQRKKNRMNRTENNDLHLEIEKKKLEILWRESTKEKSDDLLFFESLLPYIENIPLKRKLSLRSKIQEIILAEMEAIENNIQQ